MYSILGLLQGLNWSPEAIRYFITSYFTFVSMILCLWRSYQKKNVPLSIYAIMLACMTAFAHFEALAELYRNKIFVYCSSISFICGLFFFLWFVDYVGRESIDRIPVVIWAFLSAFYLVFDSMPGSEVLFYGSGKLTFGRTEIVQILADILVLFYVSIMVYWSIITVIKTPKSLKKPAYIFAGSLLYSIIILLILDLIFDFKGNHVPIFMSILMFSNAIFIIRWPNLLYILPFKSYRLMVVDKSSGLALYDYEWIKNNASDELLSSLLIAVQKMGMAILEKGAIKEVDFESGIILIRSGQYVSVGIVVSKSSRSLRNSLETFLKEFEIKYESTLKRDINKISEFESANNLVKEIFSNIPE